MSRAARIAALCVSTMGPCDSTFFNAWSTYAATSRVYSGGKSDRTVYSSPPIITKKHAVRVMIGGEEYTVRSDLPPEYTREVAAYVDHALKKVLALGPIVETHKAAILAALDITNELFQTKKGEREVAARLAALADDMAKLLPPGKRKAVVGQL